VYIHGQDTVIWLWKLFKQKLAQDDFHNYILKIQLKNTLFNDFFLVASVYYVYTKRLINDKIPTKTNNNVK
jgi:hypothetical protein